jgi:hypothetical protein
MVRVAEGRLRDGPRLVPGKGLDIDEQPHQLRHAERGVRVVELDRDLLREALEDPEAARRVEQVVALLVAADDVLQRGRDEEVLLSQAELLAREHAVAGIEDPADVLGSGARLDGRDVVALVEFPEIEFLDGPSSPEAERVDGRRGVARHRRVVGRGEHVPGVHPFLHEATVLVHPGADVAEELDPEPVARAGDLPGIPVAEPAVRHLYLRSVDDALMEDAVVVAEAVAVGGIAERGQRVQEARGQPSEAPVAETGVPLGLAQILEAVAEIVQGLAALVEQSHVDQAVPERAPHQIFQREVVHALGVEPVVRLLGGDPALHHPVTHRERQRHVGLPLAVHVGGQLGEGELEVSEEPTLERLGVQTEAVVGQGLEWGLRTEPGGRVDRVESHGSLRVAVS